MGHPLLMPGVEQWHVKLGCRIVSGDERSFEAIAAQTGQSQVCRHGLAAPRFGNNVVNRKGIRRKAGGAATILAPSRCPLRHHPNQC